MSKELKIQKVLLIVDIILMIVSSIFAIWMVLHNEPQLQDGEMLIFSSKVQIKLIIGIVLCFITITYPLFLMVKLIKNIGKTKIFTKENIKLMERTGAFLGFYAILSLFGLGFDFSFLASRTSTFVNETTGVIENISNISLNFSMNVVAIISVISIIIAMVEVFKEGIKIKEENELTV